MGRGKSKGNAFEREICRMLSEWWTDGKDDGIFWRSDSSGARATVRSRKDKATFGQYGDITAIDPCGQPLIDLCTIEVKRGYSKASIHDSIDRREGSKPTCYELFIEQAIADWKESGAFSWLLISKRDQKVPLVFMDELLLAEFRKVGCFAVRPVLASRFSLNRKLHVFTLRLEAFFDEVSRQHVERMVSYL